MRSIRLLNVRELAGALAVFALGAFVALHGSRYAFGSLSRMGPGFFPVGLGVILMGFGAALAFEVRNLETAPSSLHLRPVVMVTAGLLAFALLLHRAGLIPATLALVVLSALAERPVRPVAVTGTALAVAAIGYFVFLRGFGLQLEAIRW